MRYQLHKLPASLLAVTLSSLSCLGFAEEAEISGPDLGLLTAVQMTLQNASNIKLQKLGVDVAAAQQRIASSAFDFNTYAKAGAKTDFKTSGVFSELRPPMDGTALGYPNDYITDDHDTQFFKAGVSKGFRTGISTDLSVLMVRDDPRQTVPGTPTYTENRSTISFTIDIPLLKGRGSVSAGAAEKAAMLGQEASLASFKHAVSSTILKSIVAYWNYGVAIENLKVQRNSEKRVQAWIDSAEAKSSGLQGYLEDKKGKVVDAKQALTESRNALATALGIPAEKAGELGMPTADFPMHWEEVLNRFDHNNIRERWINSALEKRFDLQAAKLNLEAAQVQLDKARSDLQPQLDLSLTVGYKGFTQYDGMNTYVNSLDNNIRGTDTSVNLTFNYPIGNNLAEGMRDLNQAGYLQAKIQLDESLRGVRLEISDVVANVKGRLQKAVLAKKTTESYLESVKSFQQDKAFMKDPSKLLSLMELEKKLTDSISSYYSALGDLASAIAQARLQTGTLVDSQNESANLEISTLTSLPMMQ